jgi:hypothetical protein
MIKRAVWQGERFAGRAGMVRAKRESEAENRTTIFSLGKLIVSLRDKWRAFNLEISLPSDLK